MKNNEVKYIYLYKLDKVFEDSLQDSKIVMIILDASIKNNITMSILYIYYGYNIVANNITMIETELFAIRYGIN